jgi:hypothetical protein
METTMFLHDYLAKQLNVTLRSLRYDGECPNGEKVYFVAYMNEFKGFGTGLVYVDKNGNVRAGSIND